MSHEAFTKQISPCLRGVLSAQDPCLHRRPRMTTNWREAAVTISARDVYAWTSDVLAALRTSLDAHGFAEILPAILSERYEPGARHGIAVLGDHALPEIALELNNRGERCVKVTGAEYYYLPVSHCVEKQLALEHA